MAPMTPSVPSYMPAPRQDVARMVFHLLATHSYTSQDAALGCSPARGMASQCEPVSTAPSSGALPSKRP